MSQISPRTSWLIFTGIGLLIGLSYLVLQAYDNQFSKADGLINGYAYRNLIWLAFTGLGVSIVLYAGLSARKKIIQNTALSLITTLILLVALEVIAHILIGVGVFGTASINFRRYHITSAISDPNRERLFWGDFSKQAGRWRNPNTSYSALYCTGDSVFRHSNSVGATDRERTVLNSNPERKRVIILGDSFMEGMLVNDTDRVSNRLEAATGHEHLNFAINGTSPINYYLIYKSIAKRFDHGVVLAGLLPANDFQDYSPTEAYTLVEWPIYRPYWDGHYPRFTLKYSLSNIEQSISRNDQTPAKLYRTVDSVYSHLPFMGKVKANVLLNSGVYKIMQILSARMASKNGRITRYEMFSDDELNYMRYSLQRLVNEAKGKKVVFMSIPIKNDVDAIRNGHKNLLDSRLRQFCNQNGILFVPLLPDLLAYKGNLDDLYVDCDGHWSKKGEQFVSDALLKNAQYQALLK